MRLLVTGFEPFGGSSVNPSEQVVAALAQEAVAGVSMETAVLPVDNQLGPAALIDVINASGPDAVLCLGEAGGRPAISVERVFINLMDYRIADNSGSLKQDEPIVAGGPNAYFATLPVRAIHDTIKAAGIPVTLSLSAGAYLCNQVSYTLMHHLATSGLDVPGGFIHLPFLPRQVTDKRPLLPSMSLDTMVKAIRIAVQAISKT